MKMVLLKMAIIAVPIVLAVAAPKNSRNTGVLTPILGNYPDTSLPLSTDTTVTPDAPPTNTTSINVSTSTNFKGTLEASPVTGVVRITNAHTAGTYTVTVRAFDSGGTSATKTFTLTMTTPATCNSPLSFAPVANFAVGVDARGVVVSDFNGDGNQDLAVANYGAYPNYDGSISILLGNGDGTFTVAATFGAGNRPDSVAVGDFNGDGKQDLVVSNGDVWVFLGNGAGNFGFHSLSPVGNIGKIKVGDFNADGRQDVVGLNGQVVVLLGDGTGGFSTPTTYSSGNSPVDVVVGDFNGDGNQDLAVSCSHSVSFVETYLGDGAGHFSAPMNYFGIGTFPDFVVVGDFNGDGNQDVATASGYSRSVSILLGDGTGHLGGSISFVVADPPHAGPFALAVGDFNGDGEQDLAVAKSDPSSVAILLRDCLFIPSSAVSRKTHGGAGTFDINLPLTGNPGVECRSTGGTRDYTVVITYPDNVTVTGNPQARLSVGTGCAGSGGVCTGNVTVNGNVVTVPLTNIVNAQTINVTLDGVNGTGHSTIPMGVLTGDVNANRTVNAADVSQAKSLIGRPVDQTNFQSDVNANGSINAGDVAIVKSYLGTGLP